VIGLKVIELKDSSVIILDQTLLPTEVKYIECEDVECIAEAIENLRIRGAPAIGVAAALGMAITAIKNADKPSEILLIELKKSYDRLKKTRPTAVNLFWALDRVIKRAESSKNIAAETVKEALRIHDETKISDKRIGEYGADLLEDGDVVLTHCNAGGLATTGIGTALGVIKTAWKQGKKIKVIADETRPLLQGARLTTFEMVAEEIPVDLICDNMAAFAMKNLGVTKVIVGADRIARNGDTANKIGTYGIAILAKEHGIPFYVAAPLSTIDVGIATGEEIPIEYRNPREIKFFNNKRVAPDGVGILNPAFDVTPNEYITGIITDKGVLKPPFEESIEKAFKS
jgi:methylthioribose-1-phosphate isomerase